MTLVTEDLLPPGNRPEAVESCSPAEPNMPPEVEPIAECIPVQYLLTSFGYEPCGRTIKTLPAHVYSVVQTPRGEWAFNPLQMTNDRLINFQDSLLQEVLQDFDHFLNAAPLYQQYGLSHKRGYLLYGAPGTGKTCLVRLMIEGIAKRNGIVLLVNSLGGLLKLVRSFRAIEPERLLMLVFEDMERFIDKERHDIVRSNSDVLSLLDGELQVGNVAFVATTNYVEDLDRRLSNRPGRIDRVVQVPLPDVNIRKQYLLHVLKTTVDKDGRDLVEPTEGLSLGHIRELVVDVFINNKPTEEVIKRLKNMSKVSSKSPAAKIGLHPA